MGNWFRAGMGLLAGLVAIALAGPVLADPVAVNRGAGQGMSFSHRGNCFLVLPDHVSPLIPSLTLSAGVPPVTGEARIMHRFAELDLAVAHVARGLEGRCETAFASLPKRTDALLDRDRLTLVYVGAEGLVLREPVELAEVLYDTLVVRAAGALDFRQSRSGAFLFAGEAPVAMVLEAPDTRSATALRMDTIAERIGRLIDAPVPVPVGPAPVAGGAIAFRVTGCSPEPASPEAPCSNLESSAGPVLMPAGGPVMIGLDFPEAGNDALTVTAVRLEAVPGEGHSVPKAVRVEIDSSSDGPPRWRSFAGRDMAPDGSFEVEVGGGQRARRMRILVNSGWTEGLPLRLDGVSIR